MNISIKFQKIISCVCKRQDKKAARKGGVIGKNCVRRYLRIQTRISPGSRLAQR